VAEALFQSRIIIGIGGQGGRYVNSTINKLKAYSKTPESAVPSNVEFMVIDSDEDALARCDEVKMKYRIKLSHNVPAIREFNPWIPERYIPKGEQGAGNIRMFGRALYNTYKNLILTAIVDAAREIQLRAQTTGTMIILISALGGGTGSSIVTELALDARDKIESTFNEPPLMIGIGILPSPNEESQYKANACGALKELHFILSQKEKHKIAGKDYYNPFNFFALVGREIKGQYGDIEIKEGIEHFLIDLGFVPSQRVKSEDKWLDLNDFYQRTIGNEHSFSTLSYYEYRFPIDVLLAYYRAIEDLPKLKDELLEMEMWREDARKQLEQLKFNKTSIENSIIHLEEEIGKEEAGTGLITSLSKRTINQLRSSLQGTRTDLGRSETDIETLTIQLENCENRIISIMQEIERTESKKKEAYLFLTSPPLSTHYQQVSLNDATIEELKKIRVDLEEYLYFLDVMKKLDRESDYYRRSLDLVANVGSITNSMINYVPSSEVRIKHQIIDILQKRGLVDKDEFGNVYYGDDKLAHLLMVISTYRDNIEEAKLSEPQAVEIGTRFAKNAAVKRLTHEAWRYNFAIYSIMIGLKPWAPSPTLPVRLKELDWAETAYRQRGNSEMTLEHHSLFLGEWTAFEELTGVHYSAGNYEETLRRIGEFWKNYDVIDPEAKLGKVPLIAAEIIYWLQQLTRHIEDVFVTLDEVKAKKIVDTTELIELNERMDLLIEEVVELGDLLHGFQEKFLQLNEAARKAELDLKVLKLHNDEKQKKISDLLTDDFAVAIDNAQLGLESLKDTFLKDLPEKLEEIEGRIEAKEDNARFRMNKNRYISTKSSLNKTSRDLSGRIDDALEIVSRVAVSIERLDKCITKGKRMRKTREIEEEETPKEKEEKKEKAETGFSIQEGD
jgi:hypothetical protein